MKCSRDEFELKLMMLRLIRRIPPLYQVYTVWYRDSIIHALGLASAPTSSEIIPLLSPALMEITLHPHPPQALISCLLQVSHYNIHLEL